MNGKDSILVTLIFQHDFSYDGEIPKVLSMLQSTY